MNNFVLTPHLHLHPYEQVLGQDHVKACLVWASFSFTFLEQETHSSKLVAMTTLQQSAFIKQKLRYLRYKKIKTKQREFQKNL